MKPLGVVTALRAEGAILAGTGHGSGAFLNLPRDVWLAVGGGGWDRAWRAAETLLSRGAVALVSWGTAGGLDGEVPAGALLLPSTVSGEELGRIAVCSDWRERLARRVSGRVRLFDGDLYTARGIASGREAKTRLFQETGARGVDTESAAVAIAAERAGVPFLAVRAVVDPAGFVLPSSALAAVDDEGCTRVSRLLASLVRRPGEIPGLFRLATHFRAARETLQAVVASSGRRLLLP